MSVPYEGDSKDAKVPGIKGTNTAANGVGVFGESQHFEGVHGTSHAQAAGVAGVNDSVSVPGGPGVWGESKNWEGVHGISHAQTAGVGGYNDSVSVPGGPGVWGESKNWEGVHGIGHAQAAGVAGVNDSAQGGAGVWGESQHWEGVHGIGHAQAAGVAGYNDNVGPGIYGENTKGQGAAGFFKGNVVVTGDVQLTGADCAEQFDVANADRVEPGTVMVLGEDGILEESQFAYNKRVAGVVSGAGHYKPGIVLGQQGSQPNHKPIALVGKVYCKVDAQYGAVETGDLLTTSSTPGHAMKAADHLKAFGAVIGKALRPLREGQDLIPILIALQ